MAGEEYKIMLKFFCQCCGQRVKKLYFVCIVDSQNVDHYFKLCSKCGSKTLKQLSEKECAKEKAEKED